ncbi:MAG TPA: azurin [Hanamia sp.]|nr:azurin [Hanamia sp.]
MKRLFFVPAVATLFFLASCGGGSGSNENTSSTSADTSTAAAADTSTAAATPAAPGADIPGIDSVSVTDHIILEGRDNMTYNKTLFKVKAGQKITLDFKNVGKLPAAAMSHNVIILKPGTDVQAFGTAAISAAATEHIPPSMKDDVIAHTKLLGPGQKDKITFTLPDPGVYDYICTFPGHFGTMHGQIVAEP